MCLLCPSVITTFFCHLSNVGAVNLSDKGTRSSLPFAFLLVRVMLECACFSKWTVGFFDPTHADSSLKVVFDILFTFCLRLCFARSSCCRSVLISLSRFQKSLMFCSRCLWAINFNQQWCKGKARNNCVQCTMCFCVWALMVRCSECHARMRRGAERSVQLHRPGMSTSPVDVRNTWRTQQYFFISIKTSHCLLSSYVSAICGVRVNAATSPPPEPSRLPTNGSTSASAQSASHSWDSSVSRRTSFVQAFCVHFPLCSTFSRKSTVNLLVSFVTSRAVTSHSCFCLVQSRHLPIHSPLGLGTASFNFLSSSCVQGFSSKFCTLSSHSQCFAHSSLFALPRSECLASSFSKICAPPLGAVGLRDLVQKSRTAFRTLDHVVHPLLVQFFHISSIILLHFLQPSIPVVHGFFLSWIWPCFLAGFRQQHVFWPGLETQATWLRNNKETSPVLVRLCLRRKVKPV